MSGCQPVGTSSILVVTACFYSKRMVNHEGMNKRSADDIRQSDVKAQGVNLKEMQEKMDQAVEFLHDSIRGIRCGAVTPSFVDTFKVPYYGNTVLIKHVAFTSAAKGLVMVRPHDPQLIGAIQKSLNDAGLKAFTFSKEAVAVSVPPPSGEDREQIKIRVRRLAEDTRVSIRNIRKQYRTKIDKSLSEDDRRDLETQIQDATDFAVAEVDEMVERKLSQF